MQSFELRLRGPARRATHSQTDRDITSQSIYHSEQLTAAGMVELVLGPYVLNVIELIRRRMQG